MILERGIETLKELAPFKLDTSIPSKLAADHQTLKELQESNEKPKPVAIKDEAAAKEVRKLLELLYRFIERQQATKKLDKTTSKKYLTYINYLISKSKADFYVDRAKQSHANGKIRVAIHNYHNAVSEMMRIKENPLAVKAINNYRAQIKQLEVAANEGSDTPKTEKPEEQETLNKEWDSFLDKEDKWKKKNAYDD